MGRFGVCRSDGRNQRDSQHIPRHDAPCQELPCLLGLPAPAGVGVQNSTPSHGSTCNMLLLNSPLETDLRSRASRLHCAKPSLRVELCECLGDAFFGRRGDRVAAKVDAEQGRAETLLFHHRGGAITCGDGMSWSMVAAAVTRHQAEWSLVSEEGVSPKPIDIASPLHEKYSLPPCGTAEPPRACTRACEILVGPDE